MASKIARTVRFHELGGPEVLRLEALPVEDPGEHEVRLRVAALGLNRAEALFRRGQYAQVPELPSRIGYDAVGEVEAVGAGVTRVRVGDRVATIPAFHMSRHGVDAEVAIVPEGAVVPWPASFDAPQAVSLWTPWLTAWGGLLRAGELRRNDWVLLTAAASSVGLAAIQTAHAEGARVVATTRTREKRDALQKAGADAVVVTGEEDLAARVDAITAGHGVDVLFDAVAGPGLSATAQVVADNGRIVIYGYLGGPDTPLPLTSMLRRAVTVRGHSVVRTTTDPAALADAVRYIEGGVARGAFVPAVDRVFALDEIAAAHAYLEASQQVGKIVIRVT